MSPLTVGLAGDLDISRYPEMRDALLAVPEGPEPVLIDLAGAEIVDSVCLRELLLTKRRWERAGRRVAVLVTNANVIRTLGIADVTRILSVFHNRAEALAWLDSTVPYDRLP